ncbi:MAG: DUF692 family protein [Chitinophagaceae bacterium]|nr:DUF692 family protein [Chitinophagaceae bacterium]
MLQESRVEAIEWSFDALYQVQEIPGWFEELLHAYSNENRLLGHGVFFSLFSGRWSDHQAEWLNHLKQTCTKFHFDHITEHFGFMTGADFHHGAPLNIPYTPVTLSIGKDRLSRIYDACRCPVGLENLAFSYSLEEVKQHGEFLDKLIQDVNGFIILDLHNLFCQLHNFSVGYEEMIALYPLHKVREIHISGGSWDITDTGTQKTIRRDTHDDAVPSEVFGLLEKTIPKCTHLKYVVLEQLGNGLRTEESRQNFYNDFLRMEDIVQKNNKKIRDHENFSFLPVHPPVPSIIVEDEKLHFQQMELSHILETALSYEDAVKKLNASSLACSDWKIETWNSAMIETARKIARKWMKK